MFLPLYMSRYAVLELLNNHFQVIVALDNAIYFRCGKMRFIKHTCKSVFQMVVLQPTPLRRTFQQIAI